MFAGKAWAYPSEKPLRCSTKPLPANIRRGWKSLPQTNTLAYYINLKITAVKKFYYIDQCICSTKHYGFVLNRLRSKLVCLCLTIKDNSLPQNLSISCKLRIHNVLNNRFLGVCTINYSHWNVSVNLPLDWLQHKIFAQTFENISSDWFNP